jgi:hypothetical protein
MQRVFDAFTVVDIVRMGGRAEVLCLETLLSQRDRLTVDLDLFGVPHSSYPAIQNCQVFPMLHFCMHHNIHLPVPPSMLVWTK